MAAADDAGALSDVYEDPLPPQSSSSTSYKPLPQSHPHPNPADAQQRLLDLTAELEEERRLRRAAEDALAASETRLGRLKDALRKRDDLSATSARALAALQAEAATATSMLSSGLDRLSAKASPTAPPAPLPTSAKYSAGLPALAYGVLKRSNDIVDELQAQISAEKDEVYTLAGALEKSIKESEIKIIELQHLVEAQRAESGLLRTRMQGQEKEIGKLRKQIKHLEEKERVANDSVEGLMMDVTAAEEEIKRWKMSAKEEAEAGRSIELSPKLTDQISALTTGVINILNTGSLEDLQKLKGIKKQRADNIIKHRGSCAFEKIADLGLPDIGMKEKQIDEMLSDLVLSALVWR